MDVTNLSIRRLTDEDFDALLETINNSFADYIEPFELNKEQLRFKINSENIKLPWSVGVFAKEKMVGFVMHGVRDINQEIVVYNAGTGVIPAYRGYGLVGKMYEDILPFLEQEHVKEIVLEVIEGNDSAIRAYEKLGFVIKTKLMCFSGKITTSESFNKLPIRVLDYFNWKVFQSFWDIKPSWQSHTKSMDYLKPSLIGAFINGKLVGYAMYDINRKRIYQLVVAKEFRRKGIATELLFILKDLFQEELIEINNIDDTDPSLGLFLEKQGFSNDINQFEMVKHL